MVLVFTFAIIGMLLIFPPLFGAVAGLVIPEPYVLTGIPAKNAIERSLNLTLVNANDFYYYSFQGMGEGQTQMRFTIAPNYLNQILANPADLCFGAQLTPHPTDHFVTPVLPYVIATSDAGLTNNLTPEPTLDIIWMTPLPDRSYAGIHCMNAPTIYFNIRVDQSDSQHWTVWIQQYRS